MSSDTTSRDVIAWSLFEHWSCLPTWHFELPNRSKAGVRLSPLEVRLQICRCSNTKLYLQEASLEQQSSTVTENAVPTGTKLSIARNKVCACCSRTQTQRIRNELEVFLARGRCLTKQLLNKKLSLSRKANAKS